MSESVDRRYTGAQSAITNGSFRPNIVQCKTFFI
jgi:hypothetical protein